MGRKLPHSTEAEQSTLGAVMTYSNVISVVYDQGPDVRGFYLDIHQCMFSAMMDIIDNSRPVDVTMLIARLQDIEQLNLVGDADYITELSSTVISSTGSVYYTGVIKSRAHLRRLIEAAEQIAEDGFDTMNDLDKITDKAERDILGVTHSRRATDFKSNREVVSNVMQELIRLHSSDNRVTGIKTDHTDLDRMTNSFQRGDLTTFATRPATGKTAFTPSLTLNTPLYDPGAIAIFSLEMSVEVSMKRILSIESAVEFSKLRSGVILSDEFSKLSEAANELTASKPFVDDSSDIKISEVSSKRRKLESEHGFDLVVIDYFQLVSGNGKSGDNHQQEVSEVSRSLRELVREVECPVIALSQLSRSVEVRPGKHPMLSDLRESGATEQDTDIAVLLYRDAYYAKDNEAE